MPHHPNTPQSSLEILELIDRIKVAHDQTMNREISIDGVPKESKKDQLAEIHVSDTVQVKSNETAELVYCDFLPSTEATEENIQARVLEEPLTGLRLKFIRHTKTHPFTGNTQVRQYNPTGTINMDWHIVKS